MVLHGLLVVHDVPGAGLLGVSRPEETVGLGLGDDGGGDHGWRHVNIEFGADQESDGGAEPGVSLQHLEN